MEFVRSDGAKQEAHPSTRSTAAGQVAGCGPIAPGERRRLLDWLDDGLRAGQRGRLESEYPISLDEAAIATHWVVREEGVPVAHAMFRVVTVRTPGPFRVGLIGLVYTDPRTRGRGFAARCIEACVQAATAEGAALALLWSDKHAFYQKLGFVPFGVETYYRVDADSCRQARAQLSLGDLRVDPVRSRDWTALERLYAAKSIRCERAPGALRRLAGAPETQVLVARRGKRLVAYVALGRGDDFRGVAHEWAGSPAGVLACLEASCAGHPSLLFLRGPLRGPLDDALDAVGAPYGESSFALGRGLDPKVEIPTSLYLWGFDSI